MGYQDANMSYPFLESGSLCISQEDLCWLADQPTSVQRLFYEWHLTIDSDGSLNTKLTGKTFQRARSILEDKGWFCFEPIFGESASGRRKIIGYRAKHLKEFPSGSEGWY